MGILDGTFDPFTGTYSDPSATGTFAIGPQSDGTYGFPSSAQPVNSPANTAGNASMFDGSALDVLKYGVGVITDSWKFGELLDYKKFEATNGGLYAQGRPAYGANVQAARSNSLVMMLAIGAVAFLLLKKG